MPPAKTLATPTPVESSVPCVLCGGPFFTLALDAPTSGMPTESFSVSVCTGCGLARTEPPLDEAEIARYYTTSYYGGKTQKFSRLFEGAVRLLCYLRAPRIIALARHSSNLEGRTSARVLDVGCGRGTVARFLAREGCECHGTERGEFPSSGAPEGVVLHRQPLTEIGFEAGYFDVVLLWHSLEHMSDPVHTLQECHRILARHGILVVGVPNFGSLQSRWFRNHWFHLDLPRHTHHFARDSLACCLNRADFETVSFSTVTIEQNLLGFVQSAQDRFMPGSGKQRLYELMKSRLDRGRWGEVLAFFGAALALAPLAVVETVISALLGQGASLVSHARRRN